MPAIRSKILPAYRRSPTDLRSEWENEVEHGHFGEEPPLFAKVFHRCSSILRILRLAPGVRSPRALQIRGP